MRHDPAGAAIVVMLRGLKMFGMAQAAGELMEQGASVQFGRPHSLRVRPETSRRITESSKHEAD